MSRLSVIHDAGRPGGANEAVEAVEADWVRRIAAGDREALALLYRRYHRRLTRFLARTTWRADIVDEAINDVFWIVWRSAERFRGDARVSTWIMGIAWRCALQTLRSREPASDPGFEALTGEDPFAAHELQDWIAKGLARLAPEQRAAIELAYGGGHSIEEIARAMACPVGTVKARLFHARVKLRHVLEALATPVAEEDRGHV